MILAWILVLVIGAFAFFCLAKARKAAPGMFRTLAWTLFALSAGAFALLAALMILVGLSQS